MAGKKNAVVDKKSGKNSGSNKRSLSLWDSVCVPDARFIRQGDKKKLWGIDSYWMIDKASVVWDSYGSDWGLEVETEEWREVMVKDVLCLFFDVVFYYPAKNLKVCRFKISADAVFVPNKDIRMRLRTKAIKKALSYLGFCAQAYQGLYEDDEFEQSKIAQEYLKKEAPSCPPDPSVSPSHLFPEPLPDHIKPLNSVSDKYWNERGEASISSPSKNTGEVHPRFMETDIRIKILNGSWAWIPEGLKHKELENVRFIVDKAVYAERAGFKGFWYEASKSDKYPNIERLQTVEDFFNRLREDKRLGKDLIWLFSMRHQIESIEKDLRGVV